MNRASLLQAAAVGTVVMCGFWVQEAHSAEGRTVRVPKAIYQPFFREEDEADKEIGPLEVDRFPVTNADFARFVKGNPRWGRSKIKRIFATPDYLSHWTGEHKFTPKIADHPVTRVSWFAARAYCNAKGKRLMTVAEWEHVSDSQNPENLEIILNWYARPSATEKDKVKDVKRAQANRFGIHGMHGLVWEWVEDFSSVILAGDSRGSNETTAAMFCGSGSLGAKDPTQYATFMRYAHRSSLSASYTGSNLGFRCAR